MKIGVPAAAGNIASRAAHSLAAHPSVESLVIVGPATSRFYEVVDDPAACDLLVVTGPDAPERYSGTGVPMVWDGPEPAPGVIVWGASPVGLALALAEREDEPTVVAVAHPELPASRGNRMRFPHPVRRANVSETSVGDLTLLAGKPLGPNAAVTVESPNRRVAIVDDGVFMTGIALAAGVMVAGERPRPVWEDALAYLTAATDMGLVMAEEADASV